MGKIQQFKINEHRRLVQFPNALNTRCVHQNLTNVDKMEKAPDAVTPVLVCALL